MPPLDRLNALDTAFLDLDTPRAPLHVGWTMRFDGMPPALPALRRHLEARLARVPRFRKRIAGAPGGPVWVDDLGFDIANHVEGVSLPAPGGAGELRDLAGVLLSRPLDVRRPLWRIYLVDGLGGEGFALVGQAHHALVDGIAAVEVAMLLFDVAGADTGEPALPAWRPTRGPSGAAAAGHAASTRAREALQVMAALGRRAARPAAGAAALRDARGTLTDVLAPAPATVFDRSVTARRSIGLATSSLDGVREAGRRRGATINDVLLAAATLALGRALRRRGERPAVFKALVPVNTRGEGGEPAVANAISFMPVELPVAETDPGAVLRTVRDATRAAKSGGAAAPLAALARAGELLPGPGRRAVARAAARAAPFNAVVSNVPGPPVALEVLGRRLVAVHPAVPLLDGHALSIGALSYDGRLHIGVYADAHVLPDAAELARDIESAFDALLIASRRPAGPPPPWRVRAQSRRAAARESP